MAPGARRMSTLSQGLSSEEGWQDLIAWDGELYDPLFQGEVIGNTPSGNDYGGSFSSQVPESVASEQGYAPSIATSVYDEPSPFDYTISRPPSVTEGPSSLDHGHSWLSASPSYTTSATSPLVAQAGALYPGSSEFHETMLSPGSCIPPASPFYEAHSWGSSSSYQTAPTSGLFNPHVSGTSHSFSGLDVYASQALHNVGTWVEPSVEPIIEVHQEDGSGAMPIPIPHNRLQRPNNVPPPHSWNEPSSFSRFQPIQARAITIPQPHRRSADARPGPLPSIALERYPSGRRPTQALRGSPSKLSASPEQRRTSRTVQLARSLSNSRRNRAGSIATPSPTSIDLGWVSYQPDEQQRLKPSGQDGGYRRNKGRTGPLSPQRRTEAAVMRHVGSCSNCKKRKEKCDPGTPCKSCIEHFGSDLVNHPCRDRLISGLASVFLAERHGWHPSTKVIEAYSGTYTTSPETYSIPIIFGFGSTLHVPVSLISLSNPSPSSLLHQHTIYTWPPDSPTLSLHHHAVLPAILPPSAMAPLPTLLDTHLSRLITQDFHAFPPFRSPLRLLRPIYIYYTSLSPGSPPSHLLQQSLKLLVLVHVGGDITLPAPSSSPPLAHLLATAGTHLDPNDPPPTPCLIRSQLGALLPALALPLMREVLLSLEQILLRRDPAEWPLALATLLVLLMAVESVQYHAAKLPYHHHRREDLFSCEQGEGAEAEQEEEQERAFAADEDGVRQLVEFYGACFGGCHARVGAGWRGDGEEKGRSAEDRFVEGVRGAVREAGEEYLEERAGAERVRGEMGFFFDRLVARLLVSGGRG